MHTVSTDTESEPADTISTKVWETLLDFDKKLKERIINSTIDDLDSEIAKSGVVKNSSGKTLAKLDIKNKHVVGYSIVDPNVAISQEDNIEAGSPYFIYHERPLRSPVTIGKPIKDVLNYKKGNKMKDKNITQGHKDGKYVITQQLNHTDFAGDTYIEFSAPDQNAKITGIRV